MARTSTVFAALLLLGVLKPGRFAAEPGAATVDGRRQDPARHEAIVRDIASLDEQFQSGDVAENDYRHRRESLVSQILEDSSPGAASDDKPPSGQSPVP